jgi:hypothetical protein
MKPSKVLELVKLVKTMIGFIHCELGTVDLLKTSVADPGCSSWIRIISRHFGFNNNKKEEVEKLFFLPSFSHKFHKIENYFFQFKYF